MMDDLIGLIFAVMTTGIRCVRFQSWGGELNTGVHIKVGVNNGFEKEVPSFLSR